MKKLAEMGEQEIIRKLTSMLNGASDLIVGAGDDCAVARLPGGKTDQVLTTDPIISGVHFLPDEEPVRIGSKAAGRVLSDIAAMGAEPQWLLVNVVAPPELEMNLLEGIYQGMSVCSERFGATIVGGDLAQGPHLEIHVFGTGMLPADSALLRSGAREGESIYVTGPLGCSREGRHLDFIPRVEEGIFLRESGAVGAMMDISDGLATDLRHILEASGVGAELFAEQIPVNGSLREALYDGEDYELLFTVRPEDEHALLAAWAGKFSGQPIAIGRITPENGTLMLIEPNGASRALEDRAFEHFTSNPGRG
jgi:thiamine-monophosphate kinase